MKDMSSTVEASHRSQVSELLEELREMADRHKNELAAAQQQAKLTCMNMYVNRTTN